MEKKKIKGSKEKAGKRQYQIVLNSCKTIDETALPLVNNIVYNLNITIPRWKELTKVQKAAFFLQYIVDEKWFALTLRFSNEFMNKCTQQQKTTDFIRRRLNENFKNSLGYVPKYLFCTEFDSEGFHIHGVVKAENDLAIIQKTLKTTAFGRNYTKNPMPENCKIKCRKIYNPPGWACYILKKCNHQKFDIYISNQIITQIRQKYLNLLAKQVLIKLQLKRLTKNI